MNIAGLPFAGPRGFEPLSVQIFGDMRHAGLSGLSRENREFVALRSAKAVFVVSLNRLPSCSARTEMAWTTAGSTPSPSWAEMILSPLFRMASSRCGNNYRPIILDSLSHRFQNFASGTARPQNTTVTHLIAPLIRPTACWESFQLDPQSASRFELSRTEVDLLC